MRRELIRSVIYRTRDLYIRNANNDFELLHNLEESKGDKKITDATLLRINVRMTNV